jgi:hypothetical protein
MSRGRSAALHVTVDPSILEMIDQRCGGPKRNAGKLAGRSQWVRKIVYKALGVGDMLNPHEKRHNDAYADIIEAEVPSALTEEEERVMQLLREGYGLNRIAKQLTTEGYATKRNKDWRRETVRLVIKKIRTKVK